MARKATKKKSTAPDKAAGAKLKRNIANIRKLLKQRDYGAVDTGVELARSLDNPAVVKEFLKDCAIDKKGKLIRNSVFPGTVPAQRYLDYALLNLVGHAPEQTNLHKSLKRSNIKSLDLSSDERIDLPSCISSFTSLTNLDLSYCRSLQNVDSLASLTNLTSPDLYHCEPLQNWIDTCCHNQQRS